MTNPCVRYVGFSDESNWNTGRFRSLGLATASLDNLSELEHELHGLLQSSNVTEFSWKQLDSAKERFAAIKMCKFAVDAVCSGKLRVDVLIWDIQDSRHSVSGRDDIANLERMYYHLFRNVLRARWPDDAVWRLYPDEHTALDWETVQDCLENVAERFDIKRPVFAEGTFRIRLRREFGLEEIQPVSSGEHTLLQLADLFAGLAVFSRQKFAEYHDWLPTAEGQAPLLQDDHAADPSLRSQERFQVLREFNSLCKKHKLGVSLKTQGGLWTPNPANPLNFWMYKPQHSLDTAPLRGQR